MLQEKIPDLVTGGVVVGQTSYDRYSLGPIKESRDMTTRYKWLR